MESIDIKHALPILRMIERLTECDYAEIVILGPNPDFTGPNHGIVYRYVNSFPRDNDPEADLAEVPLEEQYYADSLYQCLVDCLQNTDNFHITDRTIPL